MADRVLPSRVEVQRSSLDIAEPSYSIVAAYLDDELKTEAEWREWLLAKADVIIEGVV